MDPLEFRLANLENDRIREVLLAATASSEWEERSKQSHAEPWCRTRLRDREELRRRSVRGSRGRSEDGNAAAARDLPGIRVRSDSQPGGLRAQVEGCIIMGLGAALREELQFADGKLTNGRFAGIPCAEVPRRAEDRPRARR